MRETTIKDLEKKTKLECYMTGYNDGIKDEKENNQKNNILRCKKCIHSKNKPTEEEKELLRLFSNVNDLMKENIIAILKETQIKRN